jgi:hypothetical protein
MADYVQVYLDTVRWYESADSKRTILLTEQKVDFSHVVPDADSVQNPLRVIHSVNSYALAILKVKDMRCPLF